MEVIKIENLTKYYGNHRGIDGVNLAVEKGDFFGLIGPNGAGKSTTIRILLGLLNKDSGSASIFGFDCGVNKLEIAKNVGYLSSEVIFYNRMKVKDIIQLSASLRHMDCSEDATKLCQRLGLDVNKRIDDLSYGNRKKVGIVCALQHNPNLLILDEPTGGLDPLIQKELFQILKERNQSGVTILLSSHILSEIQFNCNKAAVVKSGKIVDVFELGRLRHNHFYKVYIKTNDVIKSTEGMKNLIQSGDDVNFIFHGNVNHLLMVLSSYNVLDISIKEPDLQDVVMEYYRKDEYNRDTN